MFLLLLFFFHHILRTIKYSDANFFNTQGVTYQIVVVLCAEQRT